MSEQRFDSREEFIRFARESELRWCYPETGNKVMGVAVTPWRCCGCGYESRGAGKMYDHTCQVTTPENGHTEQQLELNLA